MHIGRFSMTFGRFLGHNTKEIKCYLCVSRNLLVLIIPHDIEKRRLEEEFIE